MQIVIITGVIMGRLRGSIHLLNVILEILMTFSLAREFTELIILFQKKIFKEVDEAVI